MEHSGSLLSAVLGLMFVLGLIFLISYLLKRFGASFLSGVSTMKKASGLEIQDIKQVDMKNRLVLARYKTKEYLFLTGENNVLVDSFEGNIDNEDEKQKGMSESA